MVFHLKKTYITNISLYRTCCFFQFQLLQDWKISYCFAINKEGRKEWKELENGAQFLLHALQVNSKQYYKKERLVSCTTWQINYHSAIWFWCVPVLSLRLFCNISIVVFKESYNKWRGTVISTIVIQLTYMHNTSRLRIMAECQGKSCEMLNSASESCLKRVLNGFIHYDCSLIRSLFMPATKTTCHTSFRFNN